MTRESFQYPSLNDFEVRSSAGFIVIGQRVRPETRENFKVILLTVETMADSIHPCW